MKSSGNKIHHICSTCSRYFPYKIVEQHFNSLFVWIHLQARNQNIRILINRSGNFYHN